MSSDLNTSTMKSPPLDDCVTDSLVGGWVSAASCAGPGTAALRLGLGATACACAPAGVSAAAPTRPAPLRKLRRPRAGESLRRLGMASSWDMRGVTAGAACWLREVSRYAWRSSRQGSRSRGRYRITLSLPCPDVMAYRGHTFTISMVGGANGTSIAGLRWAP